MALLNDDDKLLGNGNEMQQGAGGFIDPTSQSGQTSGQGGQSAVVAPGSSSSAGGSIGSPAWTNIQSYLEANPNQTNVVDGFKSRADSVAQDETQRMSDYNQNVRQPFEQMQQSAQTLQGAQDPGNELKTWLTQQVKEGPDYSNNFLDSTKQMLNTDFNSMNVNPYQYGQQYNELRGALDNNDQFESMVNQQNAQLAGRQLTSGQTALQNQIDLSSGQFGDARQEALSRISGSEQNATNINSTAEQDAKSIRDLAGYQQQLKNDLLGKGDEYVTEFVSGQWDPMVQREENWDRAWEAGALDPMRESLQRNLSQVASGFNFPSIGNLLNDKNYGNWNDSYSTIMNAQNTANPDDIAAALQVFYDSPHGTMTDGPSGRKGEIFRNTMDTYNNWYNSNKNRIYG